MIFIKNRLIFGAISKVIKAIFKGIYKVLSIFNLQLTMLVGVLGGILYLTGVLTSTPIALTCFYILLILSVVYAIIKSIKRLLGLGKKVEKKKGMQIISEPSVPANTEDESSANEPTEETDTGLPKTKLDLTQKETPIRYFTAKSNKSVVICEYQDRFVLFLKTSSGYKYLRTDKK